MKLFFILAFTSFSAIAADFHCSYYQNLNEIYSNDVSIAEGAKDVVIADFDEYKFFMTSLPDSKYELQALNNMEPSRTYAIARVNSANPELGLVILKREAIIEVKCSLLAN